MQFKYWRLFLFLIFLLSFLPLVSWWSYDSAPGSNISSFSVLANFRHPLIPRTSSSVLPRLSTNNYQLVDVDTNTFLLSQNSLTRIYPASITKLATALTALNIYPLDEVVTIDQTYTEGKVMGLVPAEKITVRSLVTALLVYSANDAAYNLAIHHRNGIDGFVSQMNQLVQKYGLTNTHFMNFDGIHHPSHYSTTADLAQLGRIALKNPFVRDVVKNKNLTVSSVDNTIHHPLVSTNELLSVVPEIEGLKTGWTPEAGGCFLGLINLNHHLLISVVTQSTDRFLDTTTLLTWAKDSLTWSEYTFP